MSDHYTCPQCKTVIDVATCEPVNTVSREVADRLASEVDAALKLAGFRWSEWGDRAVGVCEKIEEALADYRKAVNP